ncbi:MAG TPA: hypothetical protein VD861_00320, partial [Pyrinomonadaceae bacterium]|nr:hypothetical protein [Pyrinomonadaceae bacterium]
MKNEEPEDRQVMTIMGMAMAVGAVAGAMSGAAVAMIFGMMERRRASGRGLDLPTRGGTRDRGGPLP